MTPSSAEWVALPRCVTSRADENTTGGTRSVRRFEYANAGPTGSATSAAVATPTANPPARATRPGRAIVNGCSTMTQDTAVPRAVNAGRGVASGNPDTPIRSGVTRTTAGQCHRYTPYETRPRPRKGARSRHDVNGPGKVVATVTSAARDRDQCEAAAIEHARLARDHRGEDRKQRARRRQDHHAPASRAQGRRD